MLAGLCEGDNKPQNVKWSREGFLIAEDRSISAVGAKSENNGAMISNLFARRIAFTRARPCRRRDVEPGGQVR
ncbi:hypothetical protein ANN_23152 [Periplaneta americana]|uniref:Uncharacterized protein n=1 Tax=Periplaneta americana TaxID=6978 RepID=A0ABQ8SKA9_PERAM|nr:hypothetical protein ANN_23152 [Periplaneta americana]